MSRIQITAKATTQGRKKQKQTLTTGDLLIENGLRGNQACLGIRQAALPPSRLRYQSGQLARSPFVRTNPEALLPPRSPRVSGNGVEFQIR